VERTTVTMEELVTMKVTMKVTMEELVTMKVTMKRILETQRN
jgi:hypothetical protein